MSPVDFCRQLWSGHRVLLSVVGVLLLANLVLGLVLKLYLVPTVNERERQMIQLQGELRSGGGDSPAELFARGAKDLAAFREKIPPYREFTRLIDELQGLADEAGLDLDRISYAHEQDKESDLLRSSLTFTLEGSYSSLKQFIHDLEQRPRLIVINEIGLQGSGQGSDTNVRLQLKLETFFRAEAP